MKTITIRRVARAPDLAGDLSQQVWSEATWYGDFSVFGQPDNPAVPGTAFAMLHDGLRLYVAARVEEPEFDRVKKAGAGQADFFSSNGDDIEFFIDAEGIGQSCVQFGVNSEGRVGCVRFGGEGAPRVRDNFLDGIEATAGREERAWCVQLSIPFSHLKFSPASRPWKINVARNRILDATPASPARRDLFTFAPIEGGGFYAPRAFATAEVEPLNTDASLWSLALIGRVKPAREGGRLSYHQRLRVTNASKTARSVKLSSRLEARTASASAAERLLEFAPGQTREVELRFQVPSDVYGYLEATLADSASGRLECRSRFFLDSEPLSWKEHRVLQRDGRGGHVCHPATFQFLPRYQGRKVMAFGLARMDNGEIAMAGTAGLGSGSPEETVVAFSGDDGATWSDYLLIEGARARPMMLVYLGKGTLTFIGRQRYFSFDYGRTWSEDGPGQQAPNGQAMGHEGNALAEYDANGVAVRLAQTGHTIDAGYVYAGAKLRGFLGWSPNGGRTWENTVEPPEWRYEESYGGKTYDFCANEGGLAKAANGWLVAALRSFPPAYYMEHPLMEDGLEGTFVSISKDDGKTWSRPQWIFHAGRHHANLLRLPNGELVMTVIRRIDMKDDRLVSYRRGCDAVVSRNNGLTWDTERLYILDDFAWCDGEDWIDEQCGHLFSISMGDGSILTTYGNTLSGGALIRWKP